MHWSGRAGGRLALVVLSAILAGCRGGVERGEPARTIVVRDAGAGHDPHGGSDVERGPNRIEVVVADPWDGGSNGPPALAQLVGRDVKVQFRRDALGLAALAPIPPTGQGPGGRAVHILGTVRSATDGWLVVERENNSYWIPLVSILVIEVPDTASTQNAR